jgi:molybdate/tungstate transport system permease protein
MIVLYYEVGPTGLAIAFEDSQFLESLNLTFLGAIFATMLNVFLGTPVAYALSRKIIKLESTLYDIFLSPVSIPHTVVGIMLLLTFSPSSPFYPLLKNINPVDDILGLSLAMFYVSSPIYIMSIKETFDKADVELEYFIQSLGKDRYFIFEKVLIPEQFDSIIRIALLSLGRAISEFGSIIIIAYSVTFLPFFQYVKPVTVFKWYKNEVYGLSSALGYAAALLTISLLISFFIYALSRKNAQA